MPKHWSNNQIGSSLLTVVMLTGIVGLVIAGSSKMLDSKRKKTKFDRFVMARNHVYEGIVNQISPGAIKASIKANGTKLSRCLTTKGTCSATSSNNPIEFQLRIPFSKQDPNVLISGGSSGARYNDKGLRISCKPGKKCFFYAHTYFWAECADKASSCEIASSINVIPRVRVFSAARKSLGFKGTTGLADRPNIKRWNRSKADHAISIQVSAIMDSPLLCPPNETMIGSKKNSGNLHLCSRI